MTYRRLINSARAIPVTQPITSNQILNDAGGYVFKIDPWKALERFLIMGTEKGTYYVTAQKNTDDNMAMVRACLVLDGVRALGLASQISQDGRALKNDPAILVLALGLSSEDLTTKQAARNAVSSICRTGTHILHLGSYINQLGGWGRAKRSAIGNWYLNMPGADLAFQVMKYQSRDEWSHIDNLRLAHPTPQDEEHKGIFNYLSKGWPDVGQEPHPESWGSPIWAFEYAAKLTREMETAKKNADKNHLSFDGSKDESEMVHLVLSYRMPRELIPTQWLNNPKVQEAMLDSQGITGIIRNLGNFSKSKLMVERADDIAAMLRDEKRIKNGRVHPIQVLVALKTYALGHGFKGSNTWDPNPKILDALEDAFYLSFKNVEPTGKRILVAVDTSSSMQAMAAGSEFMSCYEVGAAMAIYMAGTEPNVEVAMFNTEAKMAPVTGRSRFNDAVTHFYRNGGGTNVASPITLASQRVRAGLAKPYEAIVIITDGETWHGGHPALAMSNYRQNFHIPNAKLIVLAAEATEFSVVNPDDENGLDIAGFDSAVPQAIANFLRL